MGRARIGDRNGALMTPKDLIAFQHLHIGPDGLQLEADGVLGPKTQWALDLDDLPLWRGDIVLAGLRRVGITEQGENRGPDIDAWNTAARAPLGSPWCASFASMCIRSGRIDCREASVHRLAALFPEVDAPLPADLCILRRPSGTGHVDIVTGVGAEVVSVVGGNVGNGVRAGLRRREGRTFHRVGGHGVPTAVASLPFLGAQDR